MFSRQNFIGYLLILPLAAASFVIMLLDGVSFFIISLVFFGLAAAFEFVIMNWFYGLNTKIKKKIPLKAKILNGILWVHGIILFIKNNSTTIYDFRRVGYLVSFTAYFIMLVYILIAFLLFEIAGYYAFAVYLIPVASNLFCFFKHEYVIR